MDMNRIESVLKNCSLEELQRIDDLLTGLMQEKYDQMPADEAAGKTHRRREDRFNMNQVGTLTRITDVKPGQRVEFSAAIQDISRGGMRLHVCESFIPSRVVRIVFNSLKGKPKDCYLEIVRVRRIDGKEGSWLELGCRAIDQNQALRQRRQQDQIHRLYQELAKHRGILVQVVGLETDPICRKVGEILNNRQYHVQHIDCLRTALESAQRTSAQVAVLCHGSALSRDVWLSKSISLKPPGLAVIAIIRAREESALLLESGVDECLLESEVEDYFFYTLERAIIGHHHRQRQEANSGRLNVLIATPDRPAAGILQYSLDKLGCECHIAGTLSGSESLDFVADMVLAGFNPDDTTSFVLFKDRYDKIPVIALCAEPAHGRLAILAGADNYLSLPATPKELDLVINAARRMSLSR